MAVQLKSRFEKLIRGADIGGHELVMGAKALALPGSLAAVVYLVVVLVLGGLLTTAQKRDLMWETVAACADSGLGNGSRRVSIRPLQADGTLGAEISVPQVAADGTISHARPTARDVCSALSHAITPSLVISLLFAAAIGMIAAAFVLRIALRHLVKKGEQVGTDKFLRGAQIVPVEHVIEMVKASRKGAGQYTAAGIPKKVGNELQNIGIPIEAGMEMRNFGMTGSQGVGKSVLIMNLIDQIRAHGRRMVIYDKTGEFTERFYRAGKDVLLNPFDARFANGTWSIFDEMTEKPHFRMVAEALIQGSESGNDRFWVQSAQTVFTDVCVTLKEQGKTTTKDLYETISLTTNEDLFKLLEGKPGAVFVNPASEKQAQGVRATLSQGVEILRYMPTAGAPFSIREWVLDESQDSCLFITSRADLHAAVMPIFAVFIEIAIIASMGLRPTQTDRLWLILDELASMRKVPSLLTVLTECRKFGVVSIVGFQNEAQPVRIYGKESAREIMANLQHQYIMRVVDGETARIYSEMLGRQEVDEKSSSLSFGAEPVKDGSSIASRRAEIAVVMAAEIQNLPDLVGYFKHAGAYPACKFDLTGMIPTHAARPVIAPDYVKRSDLEIKALPPSPHVFPAEDVTDDEDSIPADAGNSAKPDTGRQKRPARSESFLDGIEM